MTGFAPAVVPVDEDPDEEPDVLLLPVLVDEDEVDDPLVPEDEELDEDDEEPLPEVLPDLAVLEDDDPAFFLADDFELLLLVAPLVWPPLPEPLLPPWAPDAPPAEP